MLMVKYDIEEELWLTHLHKVWNSFRS